jgi:6-pyruvoyltetrahydropterin/6-carboxytetrahydropterin synthase
LRQINFLYQPTFTKLMKEIFITRIEHFNAAHKMYNEAWSQEKNYEVFGKCANPNFHGHNYELHVTVKGKIDSETGYAMNAKILKDLMLQHVIDIADHRNLNIDVPFMQGLITTSENFAIAIWDQLQPHMAAHNAELYSVQLFETNNIYVTYYGK